MKSIEIDSKFIAVDLNGNIATPIPRESWDDEEGDFLDLGDFKIKEVNGQRLFVPVSTKPLIYIEDAKAYFFNGAKWSEIGNFSIDFSTLKSHLFIRVILGGKFFTKKKHGFDEDVEDSTEIEVYNNIDFFQKTCKGIAVAPRNIAIEVKARS